MRALAALRGETVTARAMRSSLITMGSFGFSQFVRLGSNLILTRLLFPEAFGLMALVMVFLMGLGQFSDAGVIPAIMQSKRGDDQDFLDTAWTIQAVRGVGLWLIACVLATPMAWLYDEPMLASVLPVAALAFVFNGLRPSRMATAHRHLLIGRVTLLEVGSQTVGVATAVVLAWWWGSVWALVASGVVGAALEVILNWRFLPGPANRLRWESAAARELVSFGKWVFLATVCGFFFTQGDKMLIGKFIPLDDFGVYNIGFFFASFPLMMGNLLIHKILIPIYRETPPTESRENFLKLRKMRVAVSVFLIGIVSIFALTGAWLVQTLYDPRYASAGAVTVILACAQIPMLIVLTYDQAALAAGDSRRYFILAFARAVLMVGAIFVGLQAAGLIGALIGQAAAYILAYPVVVWLARRMGAWDALHDAGFAVAGLLLSGIAIWLNWGVILHLTQLG